MVEVSALPSPSALATTQRRFVRLVLRESFFLRDSRGRVFRLGRILAGRFSEHHLRHRHPTNYNAVTSVSEQPDRLVYIVFDQDENQAGQLASDRLVVRLQNLAIRAHIVQLPCGHDPNSYFLAGANADDFIARLRQARSL